MPCAAGATERGSPRRLSQARRDFGPRRWRLPPDQPGPWVEALAAAHRAEDLLRQGEADAAVAAAGGAGGRRRSSKADARRRIGRPGSRPTASSCRDLESVRGDLAEHFDPKRTDAEYAAAFRKAGLDLDASETQKAGAWIAGQIAPVELAAFLDDWAMVRRNAGADENAVGRLVAAARAADPDLWRDALRTGSWAKGAAALEALHKLAGDEKALEAQPAESLLLLALRLKAAGDRRAAARLLRRAWRLRPDDFWVNFDLAHSRGAESGSANAVFPHPEEAVRHLTAALAVRPRQRHGPQPPRHSPACPGEAG